MDTTVLEEDGTLSHEEEAFYSEIRGLVVVFLFFVILFTVAHLALQYFAARPDPEIKQDRADRIVHQLVFGICTFTLTISLTGYSLLPFSIAANEVLLGYPQSYYVQWIDTDLVKDLSLIVNLGTKISCLLLPFSYFLLIAQGFSASPHAFSSRFIEATLLLMFTYILVFGTVWSVGSFVVSLHSSIMGSSTSTMAATSLPVVSSTSHLRSAVTGDSQGGSTTAHTNSTSFFTVQPVEILVHAIRTLSWYEFWSTFVLHTLIRMLESVQLVASLFGLMLLFACTPVGLVSIGFYLISTSIQALPNLTTPRSALMDRLTELHFDVLCLEDDLRSAELLNPVEPTRRSVTSGHWYDRLSFLTGQKKIRLAGDLSHVTGQMVPTIHARLPELRREMTQLRRRMSRNVSAIVREWSRPLIPCLIFGLIFFLLQLMQSYVLFNIVELAWNLLFGSDHLLFSTRSGSSAATPSTALTKIVTSNLFVAEHSRMGAGNRPVTSSFTLGHKPASAFGHVGAAMQICVIHFLLFVSVWGFYATPAGSQLRPRSHSMSLESVMANVVLLLLFSSALPLQSNLLGLTTVTLPSALKTKESIAFPTPTPKPNPAHKPILEPSRADTFWWWPLWSAPFIASSPDPDDRASWCGESCSSKNARSLPPSPPKPDAAIDQPALISQIWNIFVPISLQSTSFSWDWTADSTLSSNRLVSTTATTTVAAAPVGSVTDERSLWAQFISRAFGVSSPASPASCGLIVVILLYNLCFLVTSVWIAGRHLSGPTWSFSLELVTSFRCVQQIRLASSPETTRVPLKESSSSQRHPLALCSSPQPMPDAER